MEDAEDHAYIDALKKRDRSAWNRAFNDHHRAVFSYLYNQCRDASLSEDLVGVTFLEGLEASRRLKGTSEGLRGWLITIARNNLIDERRKSARRVPSVPFEADAPPPKSPAQRSAEDEVFSSLEVDRISELIHQLSEDQRDAVLMRLTADMSAASIAEVMGRSVGAVKVLIHRGLRSLATSLEDSSPSGDGV